MIRYKVDPLMNGSMVTDPDGRWVPYEQAQEIESENASLRKQVEYYKRQAHYHIEDECELEVALEKCGVVFYDDYGHLGVIEPTVEFIESLKRKGD